jgi:hypothetical protein
MNAVINSFLLLIFLITSFILNAAQWLNTGYVKSYAVWQDELSVDGSPVDINSNWQSQNSLRLMTDYFSDKHLNFQLHYEVKPLYFSESALFLSQDGQNTTFTSGTNRFRFKDFNTMITDNGDTGYLLQNLDRLNIQYVLPQGDITLGRQVVSFGSARFINPTDIFVPFAIQTLDQEYRIGIDALRYRAQLGDFSELDMGLIVGEDAKRENIGLFLRAASSVNGSDLEATVINIDDYWLAGGGLERSIADFGIWLEAAYSFFDSNDINAQDYWRVSVGADYAINSSIIAAVEYHYNGAGRSQSDYNEIIDRDSKYAPGVYLLGEHYLIPAITWLVTPLTNLNASGFINVSDSSTFFNVALERSWTDNLYSDFGFYATFGDNAQYLDNETQLTTEFGAYANTVYASIRYYF